MDKELTPRSHSAWSRRIDKFAGRRRRLSGNELRSMRLAISRRIDRALNFSALWIGGTRLKQPYADSITSTQRLR